MMKVRKRGIVTEVYGIEDTDWTVPGTIYVNGKFRARSKAKPK
jgi:hypothetical protein